MICSDASLQQALAQQFQLRQREIIWFTPERAAEIFSAAWDDDDVTVVIDTASASTILQRQLERFPHSRFEDLVQRSAEHHWPYFLLSDCRVFASGKQRHREIDKAEPNTAEGIALLQREDALRNLHPLHVILRSGAILATQGDNLLTRLLALLRAGGEVPAASEPRFCPVGIDDLARVIGAVYDQLDCAAQCWGTYHYNSSDATSPYEFAEAVLAAASQYWPLGDRVKIQVAALSPWSGNCPQLNCQLLRDTFGIQQLTWRKAVPELLKRMHTGEM